MSNTKTRWLNKMYEGKMSYGEMMALQESIIWVKDKKIIALEAQLKLAGKIGEMAKTAFENSPVDDLTVISAKRYAALEAAVKLRPMNEAPKHKWILALHTEYRTFYRVRWSGNLESGKGRWFIELAVSGSDFIDAQFAGWFDPAALAKALAE